MNKIENINFILFNIGLFSFLFLWDLKFNNFQFRYLIILPILCLIFNPKIYNIRSIFKILIIPNLILIHFLCISITNNYSIEIRDILGLIFLYIITPFLSIIYRRKRENFVFCFSRFRMFFLSKEMKIIFIEKTNTKEKKKKNNK